MSDPVLSLRYLADFVKEALAAIAGAGLGAWFGARLAFQQERLKAQASKADSAAEIQGRRATVGNLAVFALAQIHNDLAVFERQVLEPARRTVAPWFFMPPVTVSDRNFYRVDVPSLAFLLESKQPGAPLMLMKLALEQDRYATWLETVAFRARYFEQFVPPIIERFQVAKPADYRYTEAELREALGGNIYAHLRNHFADIEELLRLGLQSSQAVGDELRRVLAAELPGRTIIGFEGAPEQVPPQTPQARARNTAANRAGPRQV
jgi:hypothetical protein